MGGLNCVYSVFILHTVSASKKTVEGGQVLGVSASYAEDFHVSGAPREPEPRGVQLCPFAKTLGLKGASPGIQCLIYRKRGLSLFLHAL